MLNLRRGVVGMAAMLLVSSVAGCGASSPTAPTSEETPSTNGSEETPSTGGPDTGPMVDGISLSELPATQTMVAMPFDPAAVTLISPFKPSHTGINIYTVSGGRFLSPGTGIVTKIELNTGNGLPGGTNYGIRIHLTSTGLKAWYHFEINGSISNQTQRDNIFVALGDRVTAGQHIGNLVSLGEHAHVHFDILDAGGRAAVRCPLVYFSSAVATAWEDLYDAKIRERDEERIKNNRGSVPSLPDLCNEVDTPN
jgi:murein DD-endopeptidase MepM/ murein hydrolase activator NlpD